MNKDLKIIVLEVMKAKGIKIPKLSKDTGIPKDRIYKWYQQGTNPKPEDAVILEKWISGYADVIGVNEKEGTIVTIEAKHDDKDSQIAALQSEVLKLRLDKIEANLDEMRSNQAGMIVMIRALLQRSAIYHYGNDKKKLQQEFEEINRIVGAVLK